MENLSYLVQKTSNETLLLILEIYPESKNLPNDLALSKLLNVSRTTVRNVVQILLDKGVIEKQGSKKLIVRKPLKADFFDLDNEHSSKEEQIENFFLNLINSGELQPGDRFSELDLAKRSGCNTITVREYLIKFSRSGLIVKSPRAQWQMVEFDEDFANELIEFRRMLEINSVRRLLECPDDDPVWEELKALLKEHKELRGSPERYQEFPALDRRLHMVIQSCSHNRFVRNFFDIVSFICHYHYQWDRSDEKERNIVAVEEHIDLLTNMLTKDIHGTIASLGRHLDTSAKTLMRSAHGLNEELVS